MELDLKCNIETQKVCLSVKCHFPLLLDSIFPPCIIRKDTFSLRTYYIYPWGIRSASVKYIVRLTAELTSNTA